MPIGSRRRGVLGHRCRACRADEVLRSWEAQHMSDTMIAGPIRTVAGPGGESARFSVVPFDKRGVCVGPQTRDLLVQDAAEATDVFLFSHGWNTVWESAIRHYDTFIAEFVDLRTRFWPAPERPFRPLLAGVFWPSAALVSAGEEGPDIAGDGGGAALAPELSELAEELDADAAATLCRELDRPLLTGEQALTVARLLTPVLARTADDLGAPAPTPAELVEAWRSVQAGGGPAPSVTAGGMVADDEEDEETGDGAQVAGILDALKPRTIIRLTTVLLMKDRAGVVGASGVADLLARIRRAAPEAQIHLIGHSYGCRLLLSALCAPDDPHAVTVDSALLLQPAVSCYCFAPAGAVPGSANAGGYHAAAARCRGPVVCTYSADDMPLTRFFHLAARRAADLGEARIAGQPPSRYAALGGYGPQGAAARGAEPVQPPTRYAFGGPGVVGLHADGVIKGHGDVTTAATAWMLLNLVRG